MRFTFDVIPQVKRFAQGLLKSEEMEDA